MPGLQCPLCGNQKIRMVAKEEKRDIVECLTCTFVFVSPVPEEKFLHSHYQQYLPADTFSIKNWRVMMHRIFERSLNIIDSKTNYQRGDLLDIGCGYGFFLESAHQRGWRVFGIEPCEHACSYAKARLLNVETGNIFDQKYCDATFDVVTLFYVLEHLPEPLAYLKEIKRILKPGGLLLVRVPHTTPLVKVLKILRIHNRLYDIPSHLSDFSPFTIRLALEKIGFHEIHTFPGGATCPHPIFQRITSVGSGMIADVLYNISGKRLLLPGVSKTTIARK